MDIKEIRKLIREMELGKLEELEIEEEGKKIRLKKRSSAPKPVIAAAPVFDENWAAQKAASSGAAAVPAGNASREEGVVDFNSPMVGTFYRSSSPEAEPFVNQGSRVKVESVLCIIEAMKVMNEIKAEIAGEIVEVLAKNGEAVEFGQTLFRIKTQ